MKRIFAIAMGIAGFLAGDPKPLCAADTTLSLDGTNDFVQATPTSWQTNNGVTVEAWIYRNGARGDFQPGRVGGVEVGIRTVGLDESGEWNLGWGWGNDAIFRCYAISNAWPAYVVPSDGDLNQWHHLAGVVDESAGRVRLYVDGVLRSDVAANRSVGTNTIPVWIGRSGNEYTPGNVDEIRLWKMARSTTDIANNWNRRLSGTESNLVAYWRCDEGSGSNLVDFTGHGFTGTLSNGAAFAASTVPLTNVLNVTSLAAASNDTVRAALLSAADGDTINITTTGTVWLPDGAADVTSQQLIVSKSVSIIGPGPTQFAIGCNGYGRVFNITPNLVVSISGLTITNGHLVGSAYGAGIYNDHSTLTVSNCSISGNKGSTFAGGIFVNGLGGTATLRVIHSLLSSNSAGNGGAISINGRNGGTAIVEIVESTLTNNSASSGAGINTECNFGTVALTIRSSTFHGNSASGYGGGIHNLADQGSAFLMVTNSTFSGNLSNNGGAAIANRTLNSGQANGTIFNSTLSSNIALFAGGALYQNGDASLSQAGAVTIRSCTLSDNSVTHASGVGGGIYNGLGTVQIGSSILNAGTGANLYSSITIAISSLGYNLSSDNGSGRLTASGDQTNTNAQIGPLQFNGGPTKTHALLPASPAIDAGDPSLTAGDDQRGVGYPRALANYTGIPRADIGAIEAGLIDSFGDGIPDSWRAHYFGGDGATTNAQSCATCDATGTGQDNLFKYIAGLNPTNAASIFKLRIAGETDLIYDPIVMGRTYTPEFVTNLVSEVYTNLTGYNGPTTNVNQATISDLTAADPRKLYRIKISLP